jgi:hypothetical protein
MKIKRVYDDIMLNKIILVAICLLSLIRPAATLASGFNIKSIGTVDTEGKQISHWWFSGDLPTIRGMASPSADVTVTIDGKPMVVGADSSGEWVFTPSESLAGGDHEVSAVSSGSTIDFTLTTGADNVDWDAVALGTGEALPAAGVVWPTLITFGVGFGLFAIGRRLTSN